MFEKRRNIIRKTTIKNSAGFIKRLENNCIENISRYSEAVMS